MAQDDIQGQVVDGSGNPVSGAIVELTKSYQSNPQGEQVVLRTTTDSNGEYRFFYHPDGDGTTQEWHVAAYNYDGTAYVNSFNNPGVTADLPSNAIPDSGVARYILDTDATDSWGTFDGTNNGATFVSDATRGDVAEFVAPEQDYIALPTLPDFTSEISMGGWFRIDTDGTEQRTSFNAQIPYTNFRFHAGGVTDDLRFFVYSGGDNTGDFTASSIDLSAWNHIALTAAENGMLTGYVNGSSVGSDDVGTFEQLVDNSENNNIGANRTVGINHVEGRVDDFRFYDKELSSTEVSNWHSTGSI